MDMRTKSEYQTVGNSFSGMESRMNEVSSTAIRIGESLGI